MQILPHFGAAAPAYSNSLSNLRDFFKETNFADRLGPRTDRVRASNLFGLLKPEGNADNPRLSKTTGRASVESEDLVDVSAMQRSFINMKNLAIFWIVDSDSF